MIWSEDCIDPTAGFDVQDNGTLKPRKFGFYVMTVEEAEECLERRRMKGGDLSPEYLNEEKKRFDKSLEN